MKLSESLYGLGRPVAYFPSLARWLGSVPTAIFLCQLFYWWQRRGDHAYIYKQSAELKEETGLSYKAQKTARARLKSLGILTDKHARLQHEIHFTIDEVKLDKAWQEWRRGGRASSQRDVGQSTKRTLADSPKGRSGTALRDVRSHRLPHRLQAETPPDTPQTDLPPRGLGAAKRDKLAIAAASRSPSPLSHPLRDIEAARDGSGGFEGWRQSRRKGGEAARA